MVMMTMLVLLQVATHAVKMFRVRPEHVRVLVAKELVMADLTVVATGSVYANLIVRDSEAAMSPLDLECGRVVTEPRIGRLMFPIAAIDDIGAAQDLGIPFVPVHRHTGQNQPITREGHVAVLDIECDFSRFADGPIRPRHKADDRAGRRRQDRATRPVGLSLRIQRLHAGRRRTATGPHPATSRSHRSSWSRAHSGPTCRDGRWPHHQARARPLRTQRAR